MANRKNSFQINFKDATSSILVRKKYRERVFALSRGYTFKVENNKNHKKRKALDMMVRTKAAIAVKEKKMSFLKVPKTYNVSKRTLIRYVKDNRSTEEVIKTKLGKKTVLPPDLEAQLVTY